MLDEIRLADKRIVELESQKKNASDGSWIEKNQAELEDTKLGLIYLLEVYYISAHTEYPF